MTSITIPKRPGRSVYNRPMRVVLMDTATSQTGIYLVDPLSHKLTTYNDRTEVVAYGHTYVVLDSDPKEHPYRGAL